MTKDIGIFVHLQVNMSEMLHYCKRRSFLQRWKCDDFEINGIRAGDEI